jgi:hypothetical protein
MAFLKFFLIITNANNYFGLHGVFSPNHGNQSLSSCWNVTLLIFSEIKWTVQVCLPLDDNKFFSKKKSINTQEISLSNHVQKFLQPSMDIVVAPIMTRNGQEETKVVSALRKPTKGGWNSAIFIICKLKTSSLSFVFLWTKILLLLTLF